MAELIERYVYQVGRYLPQKERGEIEAELRSQIQDQLDDRYEGSPSQAEVVAVLAELGEPRQIAASYNREQYLIGPDLYPFMITVLRHGWLIVPSIVLFLNVFGVLISPQAHTFIRLVVEPMIGALQATFIFSAVVVLIFAVIQRSGVELEEEAFNPLTLPEIDDPAVVDRLEAAFGIAIGTIITLIFLYFLYVGGLTLRFNLSDPGEVIPFPVAWMLLLIMVVVGQVLMQLLVLRRNRWGVGTWLVETVLEMIGIISLYFVVTKPLFEQIITATPPLDSIPEIIAISYAVIMLLTRGTKLVRLWNYRNNSTLPFTPQTNG